LHRRAPPLLLFFFSLTTTTSPIRHRAGGTFALYSLICRHANVSLLPNRQVADEELSTYRLERPREAAGRSGLLRAWLEKHTRLHTALLVMVMIGTCMVIGDGVLTPAISGNPPSIPNSNLPCCCPPCYCLIILLLPASSVFSAVSGLELSLSKDQHECKLIYNPHHPDLASSVTVCVSEFRVPCARVICSPISIT
jgi:hypothetical protein